MASTAWIDELKVKDLKDELKNRGLSVSGKKAELADRLREHIEQQEASGGDVKQDEGVTEQQQKQLQDDEAAAPPLQPPADVDTLAKTDDQLIAKTDTHQSNEMPSERPAYLKNEDAPSRKRSREEEQERGEEPAVKTLKTEDGVAVAVAAEEEEQIEEKKPIVVENNTNNNNSDNNDHDCDDDDADADDAPLVSNFKMSHDVRKGHECPYLDTISRQNLDFDFEKCCSVSLSHVNVYVCLVCGKYFQGRSPSTHAHIHALESSHHLFMKLDSGKVYCLPDMYEVHDKSLQDIQYVLNPTYTEAEVASTTTDDSWSRALHGVEYMPGLIGLNNMKANDYANVVFQALNRIDPLRCFFLSADTYKDVRSPVVQRWGELERKMWNAKAFKGHVSPHEIMQSIMGASQKKFLIDAQSDVVDFFSWFVNSLHEGLTGGKRRKPSPVTAALQGELEVVTLAGSGKAKESVVDITDRLPFIMLSLDLPPAPLYKDNLERVMIPQVPIFELLRKYNGVNIHDDMRMGRRKMKITRLPKYLVLHVKRFLKNQFFVEKNPTIVNFPVKGLNLAEIIPVPSADNAVYDLVANIVHEGKAGEGTYKVHVLRTSEGLWYEVQDLTVTEVLPQVVTLSEAYLQIYKLRPRTS